MEWIRINFARLMTITLLAAGIIALTALFIPTGMVQAAGDVEPLPPPEGDQPGTAVLERAYQRSSKGYERQEKLFSGAEKLQTRLEKLIERANADGKDTSALTAALSSTASTVADARESYDRAGSILETHSGFDEDGRVTDPSAARTTLEEARSALQESRETLGGAMKELKEALKAFREANPRPVQPAAPEPTG